jgi:hypothetical protein
MSSFILDAIQPLEQEICGESTEMMSEGQVERKLAPIRESIAELKASVARVESSVQHVRDIVSPEKNKTAAFFRRNMSWLAPLLLTGVLGTGLKLIQDHALSDLDDRIDKRIDAKFKDHKFDEIRESITRVEERLLSLSKSVDLLLSKNIRQVASLSVGELASQAGQVSAMLREAAENRVQVGVEVKSELHKKLSLSAAHGNSEAWNAVLSLAAYNSKFAVQPPDASGKPEPLENSRNWQILYEPTPPAGESKPRMSALLATLPKDAGAVYTDIGVDLNPGINVTNQFIFLSGGGALLDGKHIRNAVFTDVHVVYNGGPISLENVTFINCRFSVQNTEPGREMIANSVSSSSALRFAHVPA